MNELRRIQAFMAATTESATVGSNGTVCPERHSRCRHSHVIVSGFISKWNGNSNSRCSHSHAILARKCRYRHRYSVGWGSHRYPQHTDTGRNLQSDGHLRCGSGNAELPVVNSASSWFTGSFGWNSDHLSVCTAPDKSRRWSSLQGELLSRDRYGVQQSDGYTRKLEWGRLYSCKLLWHGRL